MTSYRTLPDAYVERMRIILGDELEMFLDSYEQERRSGLRVNTLKITPGKLQKIVPFHLTPVPWTDNGYYYETEDAPARHPFYRGGYYYLQEPSAMLPAALLGTQPGEWIADLCAAPGGKATAIGAALAGQGFLLANDISATRARALLRNVELFGISNSFITQTQPERLLERWEGCFDAVMLDAPCSGEGMFRKMPEAAAAWHERKGAECAAVQRELIRTAARLLRPGGRMVYSTCTFNPAEDEAIIASLLEEYPQFKVVRPASLPVMAGRVCSETDRSGAGWGAAFGLSSGLGTQTVRGLLEMQQLPVSWTDDDRMQAAFDQCLRIWPHRAGGEGHFAALLVRTDGPDGPDEAGRTEVCGGPKAGWPGGLSIDAAAGGQSPEHPSWERPGSGGRSASGKMKRGKAGRAKEPAGLPLVRSFLEETGLKLDVSLLQILKDQVYVSGTALAGPAGVTFLRNGLYVGSIRKDRFEPSQSLALIPAAARAEARISLDAADERIGRYLAGSDIDIADCLEHMDRRSGWVIVCADGCPLGWGKIAGSRLRSKIPAGWRS